MRFVAITALYLSALVGGTYAAFLPTFESNFSRMQCDPGDSLLNHYLLEHTWRVVTDPGYKGTLLSPPFFYPTPLVLGYSENFIGVAPIYWLLRLFLAEDLAYQWWMILTNALNFVAFAAVARWFGCSHVLAAVGGYLWAFAVVHLYQIGHQQMISRFWIPLAIWHAWELAERPNTASLNRVLACLFLQTLSCIYTGWFLVGGIAVFVPIAAALQPGGWPPLARFVWDRRWQVAGRVGIWGAALGLFFVPYFLANRGVARGYEECIGGLPSLAAWFTAPPGARWYETITPRASGEEFQTIVCEECHLFNGFGIYLLAAAAGIHAWVTRGNPKRPPALAPVAACLATAAVWWFVTMNIYEGVSGWWIVRFVPGGQAIRCVARIYVIVYVFSILAGLVWLQLVSSQIRSLALKSVVIATVCGYTIFEQTGYTPRSFEKAAFFPHADRCAASLRGADAGYVIPRFGEIQVHGDVLGMWAGMKANVPVINGWSGRVPDNFDMGTEDIDAHLTAWLTGRFTGRVAVIDPTHPEQVHYLEVK